MFNSDIRKIPKNNHEYWILISAFNINWAYVKNSVKKFLKTFNESCHKASKKFYLYIAK